jgi:hypothetical protein
MPQDKDFKRLVRSRMAQTGERYTQARLAVLRDRQCRRAVGGSSADDLADELLSLMTHPGVPGVENEGFLRAQALPPDECRRIATRGLRHESWRVRRRCARLLDDLTLTDESIAAMTAALRDDHPGVRQAALHSLVCEHCKPDGCALDVRSIAASMFGDSNAAVRRQAVGAFRSIDGDDVLDVLRRLASADPSARVREMARELIEDSERRIAADAVRRDLSEELRRKTERHPGEWVGIVDGRIITAHRFPGRVRRHIRATPHKEALMVWVRPD